MLGLLCGIFAILLFTICWAMPFTPFAAVQALNACRPWVPFGGLDVDFYFRLRKGHRGLLAPNLPGTQAQFIFKQLSLSATASTTHRLSNDYGPSGAWGLYMLAQKPGNVISLLPLVSSLMIIFSPCAMTILLKIGLHIYWPPGIPQAALTFLS